MQWEKQNENYTNKLASSLSSSRNTQKFTYDLIVGIDLKHFLNFRGVWQLFEVILGGKWTIHFYEPCVPSLVPISHEV